MSSRSRGGQYSGMVNSQSTAMYDEFPEYGRSVRSAAPPSRMAEDPGRMARRMARLQRVLDQFEISIAQAQDLTALEDYEIVVIADDSGSMKCPAPPVAQRRLDVPTPSRWFELKSTVALVVELGNCFDESGLDVFFLNRPPLRNVKSPTDPAFVRAFQQEPAGETPLTTVLKQVVSEVGGEKPVLLFLLTDGEPNEGPAAFIKEIENLVTKKTTRSTFKVQIMACTGDSDAIGYLDDLDAKFQSVDVTDDYYSEHEQVLKSGHVVRFTRGDWCMKAMLGPVSHKFDGLDETLKLMESGGVDTHCSICSVM